MTTKLCCTAAVLLAPLSVAHAAEPGTTPVPASVRALAGCWEGRGEVLGKAVAVAISAYPIVQDAMLALEAASSAIADPQDQYAAHLVFGGAGKQAEATNDGVVGYWADSFGGAYAASGRGESRADGFDMAYQYPDNVFVNRWRLSGDRLSWEIVAQDTKGGEKPFASYLLRKAQCRSASTDR